MKIPRFVFSLVNLLSWYGCIFLVARAIPYSDSLCLGLGLLNLFLSRFALAKDDRLHPDRRHLLALLVGVGFDQLALSLGLIRIAEHMFVPLWLFGIWLNFIAALPMYQLAFYTHPNLALLFGALAGPLSYYAGQQFNLLSFSGSWVLALYALFWSFFFWRLTRSLPNPIPKSRPISTT